MDEDAVSISSTSTLRLRWDVFLSFKGEDTRHTFTNTLYKLLEESGARVFEGLRGGDEIKPGLFEAIEDLAASIAIISPNYASSHWCLEELSKICEYRRLLLPVFYRVNPPDVRQQKGPFEEHFRNHEKTYEEDKVRCWRRAMEKAGATVGWPFDKRWRDINGPPRTQVGRWKSENHVALMTPLPELQATFMISLQSHATLKDSDKGKSTKHTYSTICLPRFMILRVFYMPVTTHSGQFRRVTEEAMEERLKKMDDWVIKLIDEV
ncbi:disease resistance protein RPV1-like [Juglans microcarpa x Juglans regia]|uniref:disease resistance protein RPV1-like n=1 Tax=Juglans microcarpa x Juglans regia TaxID=2249226 RepID=UPI001B7E3C42|nr:disease resistance protein RPV1-like [Juglans microcarpa x Juglans regia]